MRPAVSRVLRPLSRLSTAIIRQPALPTRRFPLLPARPSPILLSIRHASSLPPPSSSSPSSSSTDPKGEKIASFPLADKPSYELTFTCKRCSNRSTHKMSKQAYHKGTVLIQCPGCNVRHLIADHLKIFTDKPTTIEDIMKEKGEILKRGVRYENGDVEILPEEEEEEITDGVERLEGEK